MSSRCLILFVSWVLAARAANIPVEVVYERSGHHPGNRNLDEKVQVSHEDLLKMKISEEIFSEVENNHAGYGVKNLAEKIQLSPEERGQALKNLPNAIQDEEIVKPEEIMKPEEIKQEEMEEKPVQPQSSTYSGNLLILLKKAEEIVYNGISNIRNNLLDAENFTSPSQESWDKLNQTLGELFDEQYKNVGLKQDKPPENQNENQNNQNQIFQNFVQGIQQNFNNFLTNFQQGNQNKPNGTEDEQQNQQQQGPFQNFFNQMIQGFNQISNNVNNLNGQNGQNATGQEDPQTVNQGQNFFNGLVQNFQNFFGGGQGNNPSQSTNLNQSDTGTGAQNQNQGGPAQIFQNIGQSISNAFSQGNFFGQQSTNKPPNSEDEGTPSSTQSSNNNFIQNIGNAFNNVNNIFRPTTSTQKPQEGGGNNGGGSNPITSGINQFQQLVGNQQGGNPVETIQNAISGGVGGGASGSSTEKSKTENDEKRDEGLVKPVAEEGGKNEMAMKEEQKEKKENVSEMMKTNA